MKLLRLCRSFVIAAFAYSLIATSVTQALGPVLISGIQVKGVGSNTSSLEAVELRNYSDSDVEVTHWCIAYASYSSNVIPSGGTCITPVSVDDKVFIKQASSATFATNEMIQHVSLSQPGFVPDGILSSGLSNTTGQMYLLDVNKQVVNNVKWYTGTNLVEGLVNLKAQTGQPENIGFMRTGFGEDGSSGFIPISTELTLRAGGLYDLVDVCKNIADFQEYIPDNFRLENGECLPVDRCGNLDGIQSEIPEGYTEVSGECLIDICPNIDSIQAILPEGYALNGEGKCIADICSNIEGLQDSTPNGFYIDADGCWKYEDRALIINELLANVPGSDTGLEYIEIYNPFDEDISLDGYVLKVGKDLEKSYQLPDQIIKAKGFLIITNGQLPFSLLNTTSQLQLVTPAGTITNMTSYAEPEEDMSWSLIDGLWQYTNQKTPGSNNLPSLEAVSEEKPEVLGINTLASCGQGKYRHPLTNRCRNIESDVTTLASCDADEYRNPETNRCRKISLLTSSLTPCADGQERNPDTNRCRAIGGGSVALMPCQDGYERNPDTNRCRKIAVVPSISLAGSANESVNKSNNASSPYVVGSAVAALALGYGVYEWRVEIWRLLRRFIPLTK